MLIPLTLDQSAHLTNIENNNNSIILFYFNIVYFKNESEGFTKAVQACEKEIKIKDSESLIFKVNNFLYKY